MNATISTLLLLLMTNTNSVICRSTHLSGSPSHDDGRFVRVADVVVAEEPGVDTVQHHRSAQLQEKYLKFHSFLTVGLCNDLIQKTEPE